MPQSYHKFALFDPTQNGSFNDPCIFKNLNLRSPKNLLQFFQSEIPRPNPTQHSSTLPAPESFSRHPPGQRSVWNGGKNCGLLLKRYMQTIANLWIHNVWVIWKVKLQTKSRWWPIFRGSKSGSKTDHLAQKVNHFKEVRIFFGRRKPHESSSHPFVRTGKIKV